MGYTPEQKEMLDAMQIMIDNTLASRNTEIYMCIVKNHFSNSRCEIALNSRIHNVQYYGDAPTIGQQYRVFLPSGRMSQAFIITGGSEGETGLPGQDGNDGVSVEYQWNGTELGIKREDEVGYQYQDLKGEKGSKGDKGDTGEQGPRGLQGEQGSKGIQGEIGSKGDKGEQGIPGLDGKSLEFHWNATQLGIRIEGETTYQYINLKGDKGDQGIQGIQGLPGIDGINGIDGKNLEFSWDGTQLGIRQEGQSSYQYVNLKGAKGDTGDQGIQGATGKNIEFIWSGTQLGVRQEGQTSYTYANLKGDQGPKGLDGYTPIKGTDYFDGERGPQGLIGPEGPQGSTGSQGPKGDKGDKGDRGEQGTQGEKGETGAPGSNLSLKVNRQYDTYEDLPVSADIGYMCLVGLELHIYTENGWVNAGKLTKIDYDLFMHIDGGLFTDESGVEIGESGLEALQNHIINANTHKNLIVDGLEE